jgi:hypothetical protein
MPNDFESAAARLLPNDVVTQLADLAVVPKSRRIIFANLIRKATWSATIDDALVRSGLPHARPSDVVDVLTPIRVGAKQLDQVLAALVSELQRTRTVAKRLDAALRALGEKHTDGRKYHAKVLAISSLQEWIGHQHWLKKLIDETSLAERRAISVSPTLKRRGRPKGAGGNRAFDTFVKSLHEIAEMNSGKWTLTSDPIAPRKRRWTGTLMAAMEILRPYLPKGFFPNADLGRCLEHLRRQRKSKTTKIRS